MRNTTSGSIARVSAPNANAPDLILAADRSSASVPLPFVIVTVWLTVVAAAGNGSDFTTFTESASAWRAHGTLYPDVPYPNLNLPHTSLLFLPLSMLPWPAAFAFWQAGQLACAFRVLWLLRQMPPVGWLLVAVAQPTITALMIGQIAWLVAWLVAEAAVSDRSGLKTGAASWLTAATLVKPFLGLVLVGYLLRHPRTARGAFAVTAAAALLGLAVFGPAEYVAWWRAAVATSSHPHAGNISVSGALWHLDWRGASIPLQVMLLAATAWSFWRGADAWRLLLPASLLLSPLSWVYYAWILAPALQRHWSTLVAAALLAVPKALIPLWLPLGTLGVLLMWSASLRAHSRAGYGSDRVTAMTRPSRSSRPEGQP